MVRDGDPNPLNFYPTTLLQIASRGPTHNFAPIAEDETFDIGNGTMYRHHVFRFYFDGLISHIHRSMDNIEAVGPLIVGFSPDLVVQTQLINDSFQLANLEKAVIESTMQWPETMAKIERMAKPRHRKRL